MTGSAAPAALLALRCGRGGARGGELGLARSLGRLGVPVSLIHGDAPSLVERSRYVRRQLSWNAPEANPRSTVDFLIHIGARLGNRPLLLPVDDLAAILLDEWGDALQTTFRFPRQPAGLPAALADKQQLYHLCAQHGVPAPRSLFPASRREAEQQARELGYPLLLKSIHPRLLLRQTIARSAALIRTLTELAARYEEMADPQHPSVMLQEYVPTAKDDTWMFMGYFDARSECLAGFSGRKLRQYPASGGITCFGVCERNEEVERLARGFLTALGYRGIADLEFRRDSRDGQYKLLDANPRLGAQFRLFVGTNEVDVVRAQYLDLTGRAVPPTRARDGRKWILENYDLFTFNTLHRSGVVTTPAWLRSLRGVEEGGWFAADDLAPFLGMVRSLAERWGTRLLGRRSGSTTGQ